MGQKTNPLILRIGKIKEWDLKYFEKKSTELPIYSFLSLEIEKFIYKFFENQGFNIQKCRISFSENSIHILITYFSNSKSIIYLNQLNEKYKIQPKFKKLVTKKQKFIIMKKYKNHVNYVKKKSNKYVSNKLNNCLLQYFYRKSNYPRLTSVSVNKTQIFLQRFANLQHFKSNSIFKTILESINHYTRKQLNLFLTFEQLNSPITFSQKITKTEKKQLKSSLVELRKFQKTIFFKDGISLAYSCIKNPHSSKIITNYMKSYLTKIKRSNFFLRFVKILLNTFVKKKASQIKQIQIKIKGRINGASRAKSKLINIGNKGIPILTINSNIDFHEETVFTSNGTLGVKVWVYKKL